jgi:bifunctional DNase/RNase
METGLVELRVRGVALDSPDGAPYVVLEDRGRGRRIELPIGPFEASAIIMELEGITPPRPLTHDLLADIFRDAGFSLDGVVLSEAADGGSRARLEYSKGPRRLEREVRPSDAIALALRLGAPVAAEPRLVEASSALPGPPLRERRKPRILFLDDWKERAVGA